MRTAFWLFLFTAALGLGAVGWAGYEAWTYPNTARGGAAGTVEVDIPKGAGARQVSEILAAAGVLDRPLFFRLYASQRGMASRFKTGHYRIEAPATPRQLLDMMVKGAADELVAVTIPEGKNVIEIAEIFDAAGVTGKVDFIAKARDANFARELGLPGATLEGYLFPDTYRMRLKTPATRAILPLVRRHRQVFEELRAEHANGTARLQQTFGFDDARVVILASIVEKETGQPTERPRIAQVFLNRLSNPKFQPRLLQTDPTITYGCTILPLLSGAASPACRRWDGRIHRIHLEDTQNPYNTYTHEGLPPGPIANPGRFALQAVMRPEGGAYLYFVAKNDGTHQFSTTIAEHELAVVKYQRGGKAMTP